MNGQIKEAVGKVKYTRAANGRYRVVNALGQVNIISAEDFLTLYSPVATVIPSNVSYNADIGKWAEDTAGPFEKSRWTPKDEEFETKQIREQLMFDLENGTPAGIGSIYPARGIQITEDHLKDPDSHVNDFAKEMHKHINKSQKNILQPDTIANLIQSNLERTPDGYSIDALSRTMLGRTGRREPRQ